ncbi:MAG TPA: substrate-binding domain-containing protein [Galbitalea sp.]
MKIATKRVAVAAAALLLTAGTLTACSSTPSGTSGSKSTAYKIGFLLPDDVTARYAAADQPDFVKAIAKDDPSAIVLYENANGSATNQQQQAQAMLAQGVNVLVLDAFDGEAAQSIVSAADAKKVPVIDYDRLVDGGKSNYYVSFDNQKVGVLQGTAFVAQLKKENVPAGAGILMVDGSPTDNNATLFAKGAHSVIDGSGYKILAEYHTPGWDPAQAQTWAASEIAKFGTQIKGIYAANDGTAGGVIAAAHAAKFDLSQMALTGQDATVAGMQSILSGDQFMSVYKAIVPEANEAASLAIALAKGQHPKAPTTVAGASGPGVPSFLLVPVSVVRGTIESTVVADGFDAVADICTGSYAALCTQYGVK